jgi:hypothetical protein
VRAGVGGGTVSGGVVGGIGGGTDRSVGVAGVTDRVALEVEEEVGDDSEGGEEGDDLYVSLGLGEPKKEGKR